MSDLISRAAALDALGERPVVWSDNDDYTLGERNQYDMDRLAIETMPPAQLAQDLTNGCTDTISRVAAIKAADSIIERDTSGNNDVVKAMTAWQEYIKALPSAQPGQRNAKVFRGIIVEYPSISAYPEYEGKPYFSIKYTENGQEFIGYGTYKPEVLSEYLKEYFMPPTQPGWIPCSERMPFVDEYGKSDQVLATCGLQGAEASSIRWLRILYFNGCNWCFPTGESYEQMVYAWMPLPTPYREGGQEQNHESTI